MRKIIAIPFLFIYLILSANTYYVATNGDDDDPGTIKEPWETWGKAFSTAIAGDTVYFRDGIYYVTSIVTASNSGTIADPICYFNYPDEVPILDGINKVTMSHGLYIYSKDNIHIKGLTIRNNFQTADANNQSSNFVFYNCNNITIENCISYNCGQRCYWFLDCDTALIQYCDAWNACDSMDIDYPGGAGDGFIVWDDQTDNPDSYVVLRGCRSWHNSDDGYDLETEGFIWADSCWSFRNGYMDGDGTGFKYGLKHTWVDHVTKKITNCVSAYNLYDGFTTNDKTGETQHQNIYNNTIYHNGFQGKNLAVGIRILKTDGATDEKMLTRIYKNNISYSNQYAAIMANPPYSYYGKYTHEYNTWDTEVTVTDADFLSIDSTGITAARQSDGSLPDNDCYNYFLHLSSTSDLIDAGIDVGNGDDIGAFQYGETGVEPLVVFTTTVYPHTDWALAGGNVYDDGGGNIDARGVCWSESENPTIADSHTSNGTGTGVYSSTLTGLSEGTTYHARAYAHNEVGYGYGADVEFETLTSGGGETIVFHNVKMIFHNGKIIVH